MKSAAQKLCYCRFRNRHKNFAAVDLEIGTKATLLPLQKSIAKTLSLLIQKSAQKLRCCQFRNWQPTMPLSISEINSDDGVISALLLFLCLQGV
jgi:protoheme ferro-lyase